MVGSAGLGVLGGERVAYNLVRETDGYFYFSDAVYLYYLTWRFDSAFAYSFERYIG